MSKSGPSVPQRSRKDYIYSVLGFMVKLGCGVEVYTPGVITQKVSCELGVSQFQESLLAVIMFVFYSIAIVLAVGIASKFGEKLTISLSLYMSIILAIICAIIPNYYTLFLSRALTGICAGVSGTTTGIYVAKHVTSKEILNHASFLSEGFAYPLGGTWVSFLGWLILDRIGWRMFILTTSIPIFLPPIVMLHCCVTKNSRDDLEFDSDDKYEELDNIKENQSSTKVIKNEQSTAEASRLNTEKQLDDVPNFWMRVCKASVFFSTSIFIGLGNIILVPWLMRSYKKAARIADGKDECSDYIVHGNDLLIVSGVIGAANIIGRPIGYFLWYRIKFLPFQLTVTIAMVLCYGTILIVDDIVAAEVLLAIVKFCYSLQAVEIALIHYDYEYFGKVRFELGVGVSSAIAMLGSALGSSLAAFLPSRTAIMVNLGVACIEVVVVCLMKERF